MKNATYICELCDRSEESLYSAKFVYDEYDKSIRLDIDDGQTYEHQKLNRKQAIKLLKLLEEFVLHNP